MKKGFTLIELVMVIVILGILAATALPRFYDLSTKAKESAAKGSLGTIRAAVAIKYASNAANGLAAADLYPSTITADMFSDGKVPTEPYGNTNEVTAGTAPTGTTGGWMYSSSGVTAGQVWINKTTGDPAPSTW